MLLSYDLDAGALYIKLSDEAVARTKQIDDSTLVDLDDAGNVRGIEVTSLIGSLPLDAILHAYEVPAAEEAQLRAYFQRSGSALASPTISAGRIPALTAA